MRSSARSSAASPTRIKSAYDPGVPQALIDFIRGTLKQELRQCYPRDIVNQVLWAARYEGKKPYINSTTLGQAVEAYFLQKG